MAFNDDELTMEELEQVRAGIINGQENEMFNQMSKIELKQLKEKVIERELTFDELTNVKAGQPIEMVDEMIEKNPDLFRKS